MHDHSNVNNPLPPLRYNAPPTVHMPSTLLAHPPLSHPRTPYVNVEPLRTYVRMCPGTKNETKDQEFINIEPGGEGVQ